MFIQSNELFPDLVIKNCTEKGVADWLSFLWDREEVGWSSARRKSAAQSETLDPGWLGGEFPARGKSVLRGVAWELGDRRLEAVTCQVSFSSSTAEVPSTWWQMALGKVFLWDTVDLPLPRSQDTKPQKKAILTSICYLKSQSHAGLPGCGGVAESAADGPSWQRDFYSAWETLWDVASVPGLP